MPKACGGSLIWGGRVQSGLLTAKLGGIMQVLLNAIYLAFRSRRHSSSGFWTRTLAGATACMMSVSSLVAGQLALTWQDNSDNEDGFEIERSVPGETFGLLATVDADAAAFEDASVLPGREYEYRVRAFNAFGYSGYTNVSVGKAPNTAPVLGDLEDISVLKGEALPLFEFSVSDEESPVGDLSVEALSSNEALVPMDAITVQLGEGTGTVSVDPVGTATGTATITLLVSDGVELAERSFQVEVLPNYAPTVGTLQAVNVLDGQSVGPVSFAISDAEYEASLLAVTGLSMDESLVASESITIGGSGAERTVQFTTKSGVSGTTTLRLAVSDGVNVTNGVLRVNITKNAAPTVSGLESVYTIDGDGALDALTFTVADPETAAGSLAVSVSASNGLIVSQYGLKLGGNGAQRTLDVTPQPGMNGTLVITVAVSDGVHTTTQSFNLRVLAPEQIVRILDFKIADRLAVVEVENRPGATFSLWKVHTLDGAWAQVEDIQTVVGDGSTTLIDPTPVDSPVCYRVIASE